MTAKGVPTPTSSPDTLPEPRGPFRLEVQRRDCSSWQYSTYWRYPTAGRYRKQNNLFATQPRAVAVALQLLTSPDVRIDAVRLLSSTGAVVAIWRRADLDRQANFPENLPE